MPLEFDNKQQPTQTFKPKIGQQGLLGMLIRSGVVKNTSQANLLLIIVIILAGIFLYMNFDFSSVPETQPTNVSDVERLQYPMVRE